jgi:23S rRNA pseudouridine1911/1915/1917 synthase
VNRDAALIDILLEDGPLLVVNKPNGLLTEAPADVDSLAARVSAYLKREYSKPGGVYLGVPHRLDRAVSGAVCFAKNSKCAHRLAVQFRDRQVRKVYWAVLEAAPDPADGALVDWLEKIPDKPLARVAPAYRPEAREAMLRYRTLGSNPAGTLVEIELGTGRFHQIRVQFAHRGWPVLGDFAYGAARPFGPLLAEPRDQPIALHARRLELLHPVRYDAAVVVAPTSELWREYGGEVESETSARGMPRGSGDACDPGADER